MYSLHLVAIRFIMSLKQVVITPTQNMTCPVCDNVISQNTRQNHGYGISHVGKYTGCCNELRLVHVKCAEMFSLKYNPSYTFDVESFKDTTNVKLRCEKHRVNCFQCGKTINFIMKWM